MLVNATIRDRMGATSAPMQFEVLEPLQLKGYAMPVAAYAAQLQAAE